MPGKKVSNRLVAASSAAVLAIYSAGYLRTKAAADRFERQAADRRPAVPAPSAALPVGIPTSGGEGSPHSDVPLPAASGVLTSLDAAPPSSATESRPEVAGEGSAPVAAGAARIRTETVPDTGRAESVESPLSSPQATMPATVTATTGPSSEPAAEAVPVPQTSPAAPAVAKGEYVDGMYLGWGSCRHGDIQASVLVEGGRITATTIAQCLTRYSCNWITPLLPQVAERQRADVDYVSGATESSYAFADAVADALSKAK